MLTLLSKALSLEDTKRIIPEATENLVTKACKLEEDHCVWSKLKGYVQRSVSGRKEATT